MTGAVTLLDGAIGQELVNRAGDRSTPLWSTQVMIERPDLVRAVHDDYFAAGATVATANTYAVHRHRLERAGISDRQGELVGVALDAARAARRAFGAGRVAGAMGPVLATYRPDLEPTPEFAAPRFAEMAAFMRGRVDLLLLESVSSLGEAEGALAGLAGESCPVWISFTVRDDDGTRLRSGEKLTDVAPLVARFDPASILVNCSRPEAMPDALEALGTLGRPFGAYANGFTHISDAFLQDAPSVDVLERRTDLSPELYAEHALGWVRQGATIVGGCCETGPAHIAATADRLRAEGYRIT